ncbi:MAG: ATP-binding protein [Methylocella sp.]
MNIVGGKIAIAHVLTRSAFTTSRLAEFTSEKELINQTGHAKEEWPLVVLKELVDNALDACEEAGVAPKISIAVTDGVAITVTDNGPGISTEMTDRIRDYETRTSSRAAYVSPTRGAQGNALKTILAMGRVMDGNQGVTLIESRGVASRITFDVDPVRKTPVTRRAGTASLVQIGTRMTVNWASSISPDMQARFIQMVRLYGWSNPHAEIKLTWGRKLIMRVSPSNLDWKKWLPRDPTSPHWYNAESLRNLAADCIALDEDSELPPRTVRAFITDFRGLKQSAKAAAICDSLGASRQTLAELFHAGRIPKLLDAMQTESATVKPALLGVIGSEHILAKFEEIGVDQSSFKYTMTPIIFYGIPYLVEIAFGYCPHKAFERELLTGVNWSVGIDNPFEDLDAELTEMRVTDEEPVALFVHVASPRIDYRDRGKSRVDLPAEVGSAILDALELVTKTWTKQRKQEERDPSALARRDDRMTKRDKPMKLTEASRRVMRDAYMKASDGGTLPAHARQIYYQARPEMLRLTGLDKIEANYFTQKLVPDYTNAHPDETADWDIVYDDRGHFTEPHTGKTFGLGTLATKEYIEGYLSTTQLVEAGFADAKVKTFGPADRYAAILYIEKEGFMPLLERMKLPERYDIAVMSSKGMSVTAARLLVDRTCCRFKIPLLVLHDFDIAGFSIFGTLHADTARYKFATKPNVIGLGLRLRDVDEMGLESEAVAIANDPHKLAATLEKYDAKHEEIEFLLGGERVELNAMTSREFIDFVERKLDYHGIKKVAPAKSLLDAAYRMNLRAAKLKVIVEDAIVEMAGEDDAAVPADLTKRVKAYLKRHPDESWEDAVQSIARG